MFIFLLIVYDDRSFYWTISTEMTNIGYEDYVTLGSKDNV